MRTTPPPISEFKLLSLPRFSQITLPNGIKVNYFSSGTDEISRMAVIWGAGTLDVEDPSGLAMLASMLPEGCEGLSGEEISATFEGNGAWVKVYETPHDLVVILHSLNHTAHEVFPLLARVLTKATFPEVALESLKQKAAANKRLAQERPSFRAAVASRRALYGDTPMGRVITPESILAVSRKEIIDLHKNLMLSAPPEIYIAGRVTDELLREIEDAFGRLQFDTENREAIRFRQVQFPAISERKEVAVEMPASLQTAIKYHIPTIGKDHPDFETLKIAVMILGGYFGSRLMNNLREEHGYTYGVSAQLLAQADAASISITCDCDNSYASACLTEIDNEIRRMATEDVGQEELTTACQVIISSLSGVLDSPITIEAFREMLAVNRQDESAMARSFEAVVNVTPSEIRRVVADYIQDAPGVVATAGGKPC